MKKGIIAFIIVLVVIVAAVGFFAGQYNGLVTASEDIALKQADIDTQLQRRMDLIPNLVSTVKGYTAHEAEVLSDISDARAKMAGAGSTEDRLAANDELGGALSRLLVVVENYPDLKADSQFTALTDELAGTENRIAVARKYYNESVQSFNTRIKRFPTNILASMFGFEPAAYFEANAGSRNAPIVNFD